MTLCKHLREARKGADYDGGEDERQISGGGMQTAHTHPAERVIETELPDE